MAYVTSDFANDATKGASTMHLAYRRAKYLLDRWYSGFDVQFQDNTAMTLFMARCEEIVEDYEATGQAKLNTVMALSDLTLPGDQD